MMYDVLEPASVENIVAFVLGFASHGHNERCGVIVISQKLENNFKEASIYTCSHNWPWQY